jgi:hypothetical protein
MATGTYVQWDGIRRYPVFAVLWRDEHLLVLGCPLMLIAGPSGRARLRLRSAAARLLRL